MTGMFPSSGVPSTDVSNSLPDPDTASCDELWYSTSRCQARFDPAAANAVLAELVNLINKGEVTYDCRFLDRVELAVRYLIQRGLPRGVYLNAGPNAYIGSLDPPVTRYNDYMSLVIIPNINSQGDVTINLDGQGAKQLLRNDSQTLVAGDLLAGVPAIIAYYGGKWYYAGLCKSQAGTGGGGGGPTAGNLIAYNAYTASQLITVPTGATKAKVKLWGGSGGTGGAYWSATGGSGGPGYLEKFLTGLVAGSTLSLTIGAGGTAGAASSGNGGNGGDSKLESGTQVIGTLTAGGSIGTLAAPSGDITAGGGVGASATGGDFNQTGTRGSGGAVASALGPPINSMWPGSAGVNVYGLGQGGVHTPGGGSYPGAPGLPGGCIIEWYS